MLTWRRRTQVPSPSHSPPSHLSHSSAPSPNLKPSFVLSFSPSIPLTLSPAALSRLSPLSHPHHRLPLEQPNGCIHFRSSSSSREDWRHLRGVCTTAGVNVGGGVDQAVTSTLVMVTRQDRGRGCHCSFTWMHSGSVGALYGTSSSSGSWYSLGRGSGKDAGLRRCARS